MPVPVVLKFGGELIEDPSRLATVVTAVTTVASAGCAPLVIVHGGGREIDAALQAAGIEKRQVDGLRITDEATLDVVVAVLAGTVNTRFVAALNAAGTAAVGLTGADGGCGLALRAPLHESADRSVVDLGRVGVPAEDSDVRVLQTLVDAGFVPVLASIGVDERGQLLNVNADTFAGHVAARLKARRLVIAGTTPGVLGEDGFTVALVESNVIGRMVASGTATAGMIAKLRACAHALAAGVDDVIIVDGRDRTAIESAVAGGMPAAATRLVATVSI